MTPTSRAIADATARRMQDMIRRSRENCEAMRARHPGVWAEYVETLKTRRDTSVRTS